MSSSKCTISLQLFWPNKLTETNPGTLCLGLYCPAAQSITRLVKGRDGLWVPKPRVEHKSFDNHSNEINVTYNNSNFCTYAMPTQEGLWYSIEGEQTQHGIDGYNYDTNKSFYLPCLQDRSEEEVLFTAHLWVKTHPNPSYSRKWQTCAKVCVLGKHLKHKGPVTLPLFLRSTYAIEGIKRDVVLAYIRINTAGIQDGFFNTTTEPFTNRILRAFERNDTQEAHIVEEWDRSPNQKPQVKGLCISYPSHYANGVMFPMDQSKQSSMDWKVGTTPQSAFYHKSPVVDPLYLLQNLRQCLALHALSEYKFYQCVQLLQEPGMRILLADGFRLRKKSEASSDYKSLLSEMKRKYGKEFFEDVHLFSQLLNDVVRVYTMYFVTRPYAPDISFSIEDEKPLVKVVMGDFTEPFNMGDCEDGAIGINKMIMTVLFHEVDMRKLNQADMMLYEAFRCCTAMIGIPIGIVGESESPISGKDGGGHMFGAMVPLMRYTEAIYPGDQTKKNQAAQWFANSFGFEYPGDFIFTTALESTMFATPRYDLHSHVHEGVVEAYGRMIGWFKKNDLNTCGWGNLTYTHLLGAQGVNKEGKSFERVMHHLGVKAFSASCLYIFKPENKSTSFLLADESGSIGLLSTTMFESENPIRMIRCELDISEAQHKEDCILDVLIHRPDPYIRPSVPDEFNDEQYAGIYASIMNRKEYTKETHEADLASHDAVWQAEAYSPMSSAKSNVDRTYDEIRGDIDYLNAHQCDAFVVKPSHLTVFVYAMHPKAVMQLRSLHQTVGGGIVFMPYGWCTAVVFNL